MSDQRVLHEAFATGLSDSARDDGLFEFRLYGREDLKAFSDLVLNLRARKTNGSRPARRRPKPSAEAKRLLANLQEHLHWQYPFAQAVTSPAKSSVTKLTHPDDAFARRDSSGSLTRMPLALATPGSAVDQSRDPLSIGTAAHLVIASLDLNQPVTLDRIERTKDRLVRDGAMTAETAESVDAGMILGFFQSDLGSAILDKANRVMREWPFTYAHCTSAGVAGEFVVVQGVIDMLVQTPQGLLVIDFKTDRVSGSDVVARAEVYRGQVDLYARAAATILKSRVLAKWLYFLSPRQAVQV